jgi:hypothetical protein
MQTFYAVKIVFYISTKAVITVQAPILLKTTRI